MSRATLPKLRTERQAWASMYEAFAPENFRDQYVSYRDRTFMGLCSFIGQALKEGRLSAALTRRMYGALEKASARRGLPPATYLFPLTRAGAQSRQRFCRRQLQRLARRGGRE